MSVIARTDFTLATKVVVYTASSGSTILAAWNALDCLRTKDLGQLYVLSLPLFTGCMIGLIYVLRHQLVLTETALWQYGFGTKCIPLEEITSITEILGVYVVKSAATTIRITTDLQDNVLFKDKLTRQIQELDLAKNRVPGRRLTLKQQTQLLGQIQHMVDTGLQAGTLFEADSALFEHLTEPAYYLVYTHPVHAFLNRAYNAERQQLSLFLQQRLEASTLAVNLFILPHHLEWLVIYLENGDIFAKTTEERPLAA
jgi:hypothetical protein